MSAVPKPQPVRWGPKKLRALFDERDKWIQSMDVRAGRNVEIAEDASGKLAHAQPGGAGTPPKPFELLDATDRSDPENPIYKIRVVYSTLDGAMPTGFNSGDNPIYTKTVGALTSGTVYAEVTKNTTTGATTARTIELAGFTPASSSSVFRGEIGSFSIDDDVLAVTNAGYGPVYLCRNWFTTPASYTFTFTQYET